MIYLTMSFIDTKQKLKFKNGQAWREWLETNFSQSEGIWIIIFKKDSGTESIYYDEAVDIALCYGWVDSAIRKYDSASYLQYFAPRNPKSNWSRVNKDKVERLLKEGKMASPGLEMVAIAKESGTWDALNDVENLVIPTDLKQGFTRNKAAQKNFENFSRSSKRGILEWIFNAKSSLTREKRVQETVRLAGLNLRANFPESRGK